jgi:ABC-type transporter Mla MlaB component
MNKPKAPKRAKPAASAVANAASTPDTRAEATLQLDANLEIKDVEDAHRRLLAAFAGVSAVRVDVSRIAAIDTAGIQLLLAVQGECVNRGAAIEFCGESPAVNHALSVLGIPDALRRAVCRV